MRLVSSQQTIRKLLRFGRMLPKISSDLKTQCVVNDRAYTNPAGIPGEGAGKGGGGGGSGRELGGGLGKYGAAREDEFFYNKQREQLRKLKDEAKKKSPNVTQKEDPGH